MRRQLLLLMTAFALVGSSMACSAENDRIETRVERGGGNEAVQVTGGLVSSPSTNVRRHLGIPYAASPVGDLRWEAPTAGCRMERRQGRRHTRASVHATATRTKVDIPRPV